MTRRDWTRIAASGLALAPFTRLGPAQSSSKIRYCIIGLGRISLDHFMPGLKQSQNCQLTAVMTGHREKAEKIAAEYSLQPSSIYSYQDYDKLRADTNVDAVYIALPNSMHAEHTIQAAKAGKHVLCEKPMAASVKDSEAMIEACRSAGKKLMIAYRCQYEPTNLRAIAMIRNGQLGKIQAIESANGFNIKPGEWRLDRVLAGGGPLMDVGIYSLNACRYLTGEEPEHIEGFTSVIDRDGRFEQVEENASWTMKFPSGVIASCTTTYGADMNGYYRVHGSKGIVHLEPAFGYQGLRFRSEIKGEAPMDEPTAAKDPSQFATQADYFAECIRNNREPRSNGEEGLRDMKWMAEIYRTAGAKEGKS